MKLSKNKHPSSLAFNVTPMIDIVFLLIIFFMTVSQITQTADHPLMLPRVTDGDETAKTASLTINLDAEGQIIVGGKYLTLDQSIASIEKLLQQFDNDPSRLRVQLRCDRTCPSHHVTTLFDRLAKLGINHVRSAVSDS